MMKMQLCTLFPPRAGDDNGIVCQLFRSSTAAANNGYRSLSTPVIVRKLAFAMPITHEISSSNRYLLTIVAVARMEHQQLCHHQYFISHPACCHSR